MRDDGDHLDQGEPGRGNQHAGAELIKVCGQACVGVLIDDGRGHLLMFERATPPIGVAPVSGHVDDIDGYNNVDLAYETAARAEVGEEVGLRVTELRLVTNEWADNWCRRRSPSGRIGHQWRIYWATVTGDLAPSERETRRVRWLPRGHLQDLTNRTVGWARGEITHAEFAAEPGIEPVWVWWLSRLQLVHVDDDDLTRLITLASTDQR